MSSRALTWAWIQKTKSGPKFVLIALAERANDEGSDCYPSIKWLAEKTGFSQTAVKANVARLKEEKLIVVTQQKRRDGSNSSNLYILCIPNEFAIKNSGADSDRGGPKPGSHKYSSSTLNRNPAIPNHSTKKKAHPDFQSVIAYWFKRHQELLGSKYSMRAGMDGSAVNHLLAAHSLDEIKAATEKLLRTTDKWLIKRRTLAGLYSEWNTIINPDAAQQDGPQGLEKW